MGLVLLILALGVLIGVAGSWLVRGLRGPGSPEPKDPDTVTGPGDAADEPAIIPARDEEPAPVPARDEEPVVMPARDEEPVTVPARDDEPVVMPARDDGR